MDASTEPFPLPSIGGFRLHLAEGADADGLIAAMREDRRFNLVTHVYDDEAGRSIYVGRRVLAESVPQYRLRMDSVLTEYGLAFVRYLHGQTGAVIAEVVDGRLTDPVSAARRLYESGMMAHAVPDLVLPFEPFLKKPLLIPNDIDYEAQYNLDTMDMPLVWELTLPNNAVRIAVLDDGTEPHEDIDSARWDGGWDYIPLDPVPGHAPYVWCNYCYHGMATSGVIVATTNNESGVAGIAGRQGVKIMSQKIFFQMYGENAYFASFANIAQAIFDAVDFGVSIINASWGMVDTNDPGCESIYPIYEALDYADSMGVLVICGAGNYCGTPGFFCDPVAFPACYPTTFAVGALDRQDTLAGFSNYGSDLDVVAYGEYIPTTDRMGDSGVVHSSRGPSDEPICEWDPDYYCVFGGTSAATAQVTAVAALVLQRRPDLVGQVDTLKQILRYSAENPYSPVEDTARISDYIGWGRVNAFRALLSVIRGDANNDGVINVGDAIFIVNYIGQTGPPIIPDVRMGDANCDSHVNIGDAVFIVSYIFRGGPAPTICFEY